MNNKIHSPLLAWNKTKLVGKAVETLRRTAQDLEGFYQDEQSRQLLADDTLMYEVDSYFPTDQGHTGGLFYGVTRLYPGKVGNEYFMTKGHFHQIRDRGEFYWGIEGTGLLLLMDEQRNTWAEEMKPGTVHYIPGHTAHRVCNIGDDILSFGACWPSDAGHDYGSIKEKGFSSLAVEKDGIPQLIPSEGF